MMQEQSVETGPSLERSIGLGRVLFQSVTTMAPGASVVFGLGLRPPALAELTKSVMTCG